MAIKPAASSFLVTKHSWKGKYRRVLTVGPEAFSTHNPSSMEVTNSWKLTDVIGMQALSESEFQVTFRKGAKKQDNMRFSSEFRPTVLSEGLRWLQLSGNDSAAQATKTWFAYKYHWSEQRVSTAIRVGNHAVDQMDPSGNGKILASYFFKDIIGLYEVPDYPGGFIIEVGPHSRLHLFAAEARSEILSHIIENSGQFVGVTIAKAKTMTFDKFVELKFGTYRGDVHITSISEFLVYKQSHRHQDPVRRLLCLTETCLLERDPATYSIVSLRPLSQVCALVRHSDHPQLVTVQYVSGEYRSYTSTDRDSLIASFLDGVRGSGNRDVHVRLSMVEREKRLSPLNTPVEEEVESSHLKFLVQPPPTWSFVEAMARFNANVSYSGLVHSVTAEHLFAENKEKLINSALMALITKDIAQDDLQGLEQQFHALRRLVASKAGFAAFTTLPGFREKIGVKVNKALKLGHDGISHAAIDMVCALMEPMHEDYDLRQEQLNKSSLLSSERFLDGLLDMWTTHVMRGTGALVVAAMLDLLTFALCAPYSETTDGKQFDILLEKVADRGRTLYRLFQCPSHTIVKGAGLIMKAIIEEASPETGAKMQMLALAEGAVPVHLLSALYTKSAENRLLMQRQLSRHLIGLWTAENDAAIQLLERILPAGLLHYLQSDASTPTSEKDRLHVRDNLSMALSDQEKAKSPALLLAAGKGLKQGKEIASKTAEYLAENTYHYTEEAKKLAERHLEVAMQHWRTRMGKDWNAPSISFNSGESKEPKPLKPQERPIVLRKRRQRVKSSENWPLFYYQFEKDHAKPNLIWNFKTRQELQDCLQIEVQTFLQDRELAGGTLISWNHQEFIVNYNSLSDEIKIGDYFLRLLLEEDTMNNEDSPINKSGVFFNDLYHRFILTPKTEMKCLCLQAMAIVYGRHYGDIGPFHDTKYIVAMLDRTLDKVERDRLLLFLNKLIMHKENAAALIQANGVKILIDLLPLAHLHTTRAVMASQSMAIEASQDTTQDMQEKEWYYGNATKEERNGPISFSELKDLFGQKIIHAKTKVWAQGLEGWRLLQQVSQLKWTLLAKGTAVMNESEMSALILSMLAQICKYYPSKDEDGAVIRPLPKIKQALSDPSHLPHIVQLLLTFDPILVERVAALLHFVLEDNPRMPTLYLTGCFFFILMYMGNNLLPIGRFLAITHNKQAYRSEDAEGQSEIKRQSLLTQMLPEAMVAYLENHGPEKFAQIFLGEYDTPEAIWSHEMRTFMIQKIAYHLADFTPRLKSNVRALYQYCPIPMISFPRLEAELFCDIYYLRNLCNDAKFPDWPITNPLKLLKEVLMAWKQEVEKKPSSMTATDALKILGLGPQNLEAEEGVIRKAYFKMAQQYHPDKNPKGREMFEKVNTAYEFLCSRSAKSSDAPDANNIVLVLRTQSILFCRYSEELHPYKYAGYPMLIKTIQLETDDEKLFSKSAPLLAAAAECAYYTVKCSALNAEEMRRENGLEVLYLAFERCISVLNNSSKPDEIAVQVCIHITRFYSVATQFQMCRDRMVEMPELVKNVCRIFYYKHLTALCAVAAECVAALAIDGILQMHLLQAGVLWHLLIFLFDYDYTLEEGGVDAEEENSKQLVANKLAKLAVTACARLAGLFEQQDLASPKNPVIEESLSAMITPYIVYKMGQNQPEEVLKLLNSNVESPYLIWDNGTRAELVDFLENEATSTVRRGTCDPSFGSEFKFSAHKDEIIVGSIFVRIYNQQPMFQLEEPKKFAVDLLGFLNGETQYLYSQISLAIQTSDTPSERIQSSEMALEALSNVIKHNRGVDIQCIGHFKLLFSLLRLRRCPKIQEMALQVLLNVTGSSECVDDIAANLVLVNVLHVLYTLPEHRSVALDLLHAMSGETKLVKECLQYGGIITLVYLFCNSQDQVVREKSAEVLCKMSGDKLMGPKVRIAVSKFLPEIFLDAMKKSVEACIQMFEGCHENPELIWNDDSRKRLTIVSKRLAEGHVQHLDSHAETPWNAPAEEIQRAQSFVTNELVISGIYVRLFIANPGWVLRKPREFLSDLLENALQSMQSSNPNLESLETITTALVKLLEAQPALADMVPATGYISRILSSISNLDNKFQKPGVLMINTISRSTVCVEALAKCETIAPLKRAMNLRNDLIYPTCETFSTLFQGHHDSLVKQALQCDLIKDLLALLDAPLRDQPSPSATKALIVKALKAMTHSLLHGEEVSSLLKSNPVWQQYEQQKHDLFLPDRPNAGYLTAAPGVAGYLTSSSMRKTVPNVPPPMDSNNSSHNDSLI